VARGDNDAAQQHAGPARDEGAAARRARRKRPHKARPPVLTRVGARDSPPVVRHSRALGPGQALLLRKLTVSANNTLHSFAVWTHPGRDGAAASQQAHRRAHPTHATRLRAGARRRRLRGRSGCWQVWRAVQPSCGNRFAPARARPRGRAPAR
jgi:hypothetical protein